MSTLLDWQTGQKLHFGATIRDSLGRRWEVLGWTAEGDVFVRLDQVDAPVLSFDIARFGLTISYQQEGIQ